MLEGSGLSWTNKVDPYPAFVTVGVADLLALGPAAGTVDGRLVGLD